MDQAPKYSVKEYHDYLVRDFETHRVFIGMDVFMKHVLQVPNE